MAYSSLIFVYGFLPVSLLLYCISPPKFRNTMLLLLSMTFCAFRSIYFLVFVAEQVLVNYIAGLFIEKLDGKKYYSVVPFTAGIAIDLITFLMYRSPQFSWLKQSFNVPEHFFPIGVSFLVLSSVSYLVDVYRKSIKAESDIVKFSLYMMMFPKITAGPLMRYGTFCRILDEKKCGLSRTGTGITIFVKGLAKKVIAGDSLYKLYLSVMSIETSKLSTVNAWLGAGAYLMCIYFSLSGIADMGTGLGYCFGMKFPRSFNYPLFSAKIRTFASNWNVQVFHWFKRYIYSPMIKVSSNRNYRGLVFVFVWGLIGAWYVFSTNGLVWGILLGTAMLSERLIKDVKIRATGIVFTVIATTVLSVFLFCDSISHSLYFIFAMIGGNKIIADYITVYLLRNYVVVFLVCLYASTSLFRNMMTRSGNSKLKNVISVMSPVILIVLLIICTALMSQNGSSETVLIRL